MALSKEETKQELSYLNETSIEIAKQLEELGKEINVKEEEITEFKKMLWESNGSVDKVEMQTSLMASEMEANFMLLKMDYYKRLFKAQNNPYFGRIDFKEEYSNNVQKIYIGITNVTKDLFHYVHDWRSPIASLFYDYGVGPAKYEAPFGEIKGDMLIRRQYKIEDKKMKHIFDSNINVVDDCLQEVLAESGSEKMKNIVNTIQKEQNDVIRNVNNKNLIVQGIAGSGKTSVALHRIAFLLYKIKNLKSTNVLIFSPNNVFTEYISDVLPELGEENAVATTFHEFANKYISECKKVETFTDFIEKYYVENKTDEEFIKFKLSNKIVSVIDEYAKKVEDDLKIKNGITIDKIYDVDKEYLNYLLKERYNKIPLFERIDLISEHLCNKFDRKVGKFKRSISKLIKEQLNIKIDFIKLYENMYQSDIFEKAFGKKKEVFINKNLINYEDALCFIYLKGLLNGFPYSNLIKQIVVDEAQDYNELQYIILSKIFKKASFTILGDVNQTINPYQKYDSLEVLTNILNDNSKYIELNKTYRSSSEIIEFANKILNLKHVSAIRNKSNTPVIIRNNYNLEKDINYLKDKYNSLAIITKDKKEALKLYDNLKLKFPRISVMEDSKKEFNKDFVIVPCYLAKGLEFDSVISYTSLDNKYTEKEKYLFYVAVTRCQHELIVYNCPSNLYTK